MRVASAHTWVLLLDRTERTDEALPAVRVWLAQNTGAGLEARPWHAMADFYQKTVDLFTRQINVVRLMIAVIIIVSITNTLIMGILERTAEIGTLMALGQRRQQILRLFVTEGAFLGVIGGTAGLLLGWLLAIVVSTLGIPMPPPPGMDVAFVGEIRVTGPLAAGAFVIALLATVAASVYPAWRASRLRIVDALRQAR
jgi:putative ABC transport system permease protein